MPPRQMNFRLEIFVETFLRALAAETRLLDAAERHDLVGEDALVNADHAGFERFRDAPCPRDVLAEEVSSKSERRVVRDPDRVGFRLEADERGDRPEDLFVRDKHVGFDAGHDRRREEQRAMIVRLAAHLDFRAMRDGVRKQRLHLLDRVRVDQRTDCRFGVASRRHDELCSRFLERGDELIEDARLHENSVGADAGLSGIAEFRCHCPGDGLLQVGVVEDDQRRVAAKLERQLFDRVGALAIEDASNLGRAGERQLPDAVVCGQNLSDARSIERRDDVKHARRNASIESQAWRGQEHTTVSLPTA